MTAPVIRPGEMSLLRTAAGHLRDIHDRGFVDYGFPATSSLEALADELDAFLSVYSGVGEAAALRVID